MTNFSSKPERLLKSGEFAELCGTTKETILHFARMGVLLPYRTERNRYRVYRPEQLYDYEFIMLLQKTGATLDDIRQLRGQMDAPSVINHIEGGIEQLRLEAQHLLNLANDFEQQVKEAKEIEAAPKATLIVREEPALTLSCVTIDRPSEDHHLAWLRNYIAFMCDKGQRHVQPAGMLLKTEGLLTGRLMPLAFVTQDEKVGESLVIPQGRAALWYFSGTLNDFHQGLKAFAVALEASGLTPKCEALIFDRASYLIQQKMDEIACKVMVPLEKLASRVQSHLHTKLANKSD